MQIPVRSRCHRILRGMKNYHSFLSDKSDCESKYPQYLHPINLDEDESLVGCYENKFGEIINENIPSDLIWHNIIITNKAMHLCAHEKRIKIYFKDISEVEGPKNKIDDLFIHIYLQDTKIDLPILYTHGENGRLKDVFGFLRFLMSVIADQRDNA